MSTVWTPAVAFDPDTTSDSVVDEVGTSPAWASNDAATSYVRLAPGADVAFGFFTLPAGIARSWFDAPTVRIAAHVSTDWGDLYLQVQLLTADFAVASDDNSDYAGDWDTTDLPLAVPFIGTTDDLYSAYLAGELRVYVEAGGGTGTVDAAAQHVGVTYLALPVEVSEGALYRRKATDGVWWTEVNDAAGFPAPAGADVRPMYAKRTNGDWLYVCDMWRPGEHSNIDQPEGVWVQPDDVTVTVSGGGVWAGPTNGYAIERYPADTSPPNLDQDAHDCAWEHMRVGHGNVLDFWGDSYGKTCPALPGSVSDISTGAAGPGDVIWVGDVTSYFVGGAGTMPDDVDSIQILTFQGYTEFDLLGLLEPTQYAPVGALQEAGQVALLSAELSLDAPTFDGTEPWQLRAHLFTERPDLAPGGYGWLLPDDAAARELIASLDFPGTSGPYSAAPTMTRDLTVDDLTDEGVLFLHLASGNWFDDVAPPQQSPGIEAQGWSRLRFAYVLPELTVTIRPPRYYVYPDGWVDKGWGWVWDAGVFLGSAFSDLAGYPTALPPGATELDLIVAPDGWDGEPLPSTPYGDYYIYDSGGSAYSAGFEVPDPSSPQAGSHLWVIWYGPAFDTAVDPPPWVLPKTLAPAALAEHGQG